MNLDWVLKPCCDWCGSTSDLFGSNCKHTTLCLECGKGMAANPGRCHQCGAFITNLIREYNLQAIASTDKAFYIGRFASGLPPFSEDSAENMWSSEKEGLPGRQPTDILRNKNKPWILEDETGQHQFQGQVEGPQSSTATHYLLMVHGWDCFPFPAGSRYNFSKIAQCKQLTLEEAEEKMNKRRHNATGYERWMMKTATNGAAVFHEVKKNEGISKAEADEGNRVKKLKRNDEGDHPDKGDEDEEEWEARNNRFALNKMGVDDDEGGKGGDFDLDDDDIEKGDDWEHEETFTDDDEAVGNDTEEREELDLKFPAPPEIKQDEEDEDEENGGLSKSGKEIKKLLGQAAGLNESKGEEEEEEEEESEDDDEISMSHVLAPKLKDAPKDEPAETTPTAASHPPGSGCSIPAVSKSSRAKRKRGSNDKNSNNSLPVKTENTIVKAKAVMNSYKPSVSTKPPSSTAMPGSTSPSTAAITEEEIRTAVAADAPVTAQDLVAKFKSRMETSEEKRAFTDILRRISKILKVNGHSYIVIRDK